MRENPETGALENFNFNLLLEEVPELKRFDYSISTFTFNPPIDSSDMQLDHWAKLVKIISTNYEFFDGFVILHGTDTMAYTASALSFMLENLGKPVILTGSQLPIGTLRTDGKENLITAIEIAAAKNAEGHPMVPEVCVFFHENLMRGNRTTKINSESFGAFGSNNYPNLAKAGTDIQFFTRNIRKYVPGLKLKAHHEYNSNIVIFSLFPGIQQEVVEKLLGAKELKGIIFRTYGAGNAPSKGWFLDMVTEATKMGKILLNVTQCRAGSVNMDIYATGKWLKEAGVINGFDSTTESALAKLFFLMGQSDSDSDIAQLLESSLRGEISK